MDIFFTRAEPKITLEKASREKDWPPPAKTPSPALRLANLKLLELVTRDETDSGLLAKSIANAALPNGDFSAKAACEAEALDCVLALKEGKSLFAQFNVACKYPPTIVAEIDVAQGEIRGIQAPPGGIRLVFTKEHPSTSCGGSWSVTCFEGFTLAAKRTTRSVTFVSKYRGVVIVVGEGVCSVVRYKSCSGRLRLKEISYIAFGHDESRLLGVGHFLVDGTTSPPTLIYSNSEDGFTARIGDIRERKLEMECIFTSQTRTRIYCDFETASNISLNFAVDENGRIWLNARSLVVLAPDLTFLDEFSTAAPCVIFTSPRGGVVISDREEEHYFIRYDVKRVDPEDGGALALEL